VEVPDAVAFLAFPAVLVGVNDQQDEEDEAANQQNDHARLALPHIANEILEGRVHPA